METEGKKTKLVARYEELEEQVSEFTRAQAELIGQERHALSLLKTLGFENIDDARKALVKLEKEYEQKLGEFESSLNELEDLLRNPSHE